MKKIIIALIFITGSLFAQTGASFKFGDVGTWWIPKFKPFGNSTTFTDSTNYVTLNKGFYAYDSIKAGAWIFAGSNKQGGLYLDTNKMGEVSFTGQSMYLYNRKENGYMYLYSGEKLSGFSFNKFSGGATSEIASIDTVTGFSLYSGNIQINQAENPTGQIKLPSDTASDYDADDAITLNRQSGVITTKSLTTAAQNFYTLTLTNSLISANTKIFAVVRTNAGNGVPIVTQCPAGSGSGTILVFNAHASSAFNSAITIAFIIFN